MGFSPHNVAALILCVSGGGFYMWSCMTRGIGVVFVGWKWNFYEVWLAGVGGRLSCSGYILICFNGTDGLRSKCMVGPVL